MTDDYALWVIYCPNTSERFCQPQHAPVCCPPISLHASSRCSASGCWSTAYFVCRTAIFPSSYFLLPFPAGQTTSSVLFQSLPRSACDLHWLTLTYEEVIEWCASIKVSLNAFNERHSNRPHPNIEQLKCLTALSRSKLSDKVYYGEIWLNRGIR